MRPSDSCRSAIRLPRLETLQPRIVLSSQTAAAASAAYVLQDEVSQDAETSGGASPNLPGLAQVRADYGFTGVGQTVVVIDTGIDYNHEALGGGMGNKVIAGYDFTGDHASDPTNAYDDGPNGSHGTHVAGIIASQSIMCPGIAPGVDLISLRVFNDAGDSSFTWVDEALQWVNAHQYSFQYPITTVNMSLGEQYNGVSPPADAPLETDLAQLNADGIFITAAAGNSFSTYNAPGVTYPAASPYVVPVMSETDDGSAISSFSQRDSRAIAAPGESILSSVPNYVINPNGPDDYFARYSGTSMAAPAVAAGAVLIRQADEAVGMTDITPNLIYQQMISNADSIYDPATSQSYHSLNLGATIDAIMSHSPASRAAAAVGVYHAASGQFLLAGAAGSAGTTVTFAGQQPNWIPISGDFNGDGTQTVGMYDPTTSTFYLKDNNASGGADLVFGFGAPDAGWLPIVGDWTGSGVQTVGLYDPATSTFYLRNSNTSGTADETFAYGRAGAGWLPVAGDWNGDGQQTVGLYDPASSVFYLRNSNTTGYADLTIAYGSPGAGWLPVSGDWTASGVQTIGLYDPATSTFFLRNSNTSGTANVTTVYGPPGSRPVAGNWQGAATTSALALPATAALDPASVADAVVGTASLPAQTQSAVTERLTAQSLDQAQGLSNLTVHVDMAASGAAARVDPRAVDLLDLQSLAAESSLPTSAASGLGLAIREQVAGEQNSLANAGIDEAACTDAVFSGADAAAVWQAG